MKKRSASWALIAISALLQAGCGGGDGADGIIGTGFNISGAANKGPFVIGSSVTVSVLSDDGEPTANTIVTKTSNDLGQFSFKLENPGPVQINVQGYHFNEITGRLSNSTLTLRAIYDASEQNQQNAQVNILTHIANDRIAKHMRNGKPAAEAIPLAQTELVKALEPVLKTAPLPAFTDLSIYNIDDTHELGNAYLLALSSIAYQYATSRSKLEGDSVDAELTLLLNKLASDFGDDGQFADTDLIQRLSSASRLLRPDQIIQNLVYRSYAVLGIALEAADLNRFIDTDGDGQVNIIDIDDDNDGILDIEDIEPYGVNKATIQITNPTDKKKVSGMLVVSGTANEFTEVVKVKIGDGPFIEAQGKAAWSISIDTTQLPDRETTIVVRAVQSDWGYTDKEVRVTVENVDPIVGTWSCFSKLNGGYTYGDQWFTASGAMNASFFSCWVSGWQRQGADIIVNRTNCESVRFTPIFSSENNLLEIDGGSYAAPLSCKRVT